ncbi:MAG: glycosyltransferase, partial [Methanobacterium sp.]
MKISDVIISLAGHNTTMEIASLGIPNIIVPIENHSEQLKNALAMKKYGISIIKEINELNSKNLSNEINKMLKNGYLEKINEIKKEFSKYDGTVKAAEIILKSAELNDE